MPRIDGPKSSRKYFKYLWLLPIALLALPMALKVLGVRPINRARTDPANPDASMRPRFYAASPQEVQKQVLEVVPTLSTYGRKWRAGQASQIEPLGVQVEVPVLFFTDDLSVSITAYNSGSRVDVESASRVGQGDFGENARHIRQFLKALDKKLL